MIIEIAEVVPAEELVALRSVLEEAGLYESGAKTAGWHARQRKNNLQAAEDSPQVRGVLRKVEAVLDRNELFQAAARPKKIAKLLLSRYEPGMVYGPHVDDAVMAGQRTDISFTLFLSDPATYEGGELVIERTEGEKRFKPPAGHLVLYPSTTLHQVAPVSHGTRLAAVGWVRSLIRQPARRELLFDLDRVVHLLREGNDAERALDLVLKTRSNLMREWLED